MNDNSFSVEHEKENIIIHGKPYPFTIFLSAEDYFTPQIASASWTPAR